MSNGNYKTGLYHYELSEENEINIFYDDESGGLKIYVSDEKTSRIILPFEKVERLSKFLEEWVCEKKEIIKRKVVVKDAISRIKNEFDRETVILIFNKIKGTDIIDLIGDKK